MCEMRTLYLLDCRADYISLSRLHVFVGQAAPTLEQLGEMLGCAPLHCKGYYTTLHGHTIRPCVAQ